MGEDGSVVVVEQSHTSSLFYVKMSDNVTRAPHLSPSHLAVRLKVSQIKFE